MRNHSAPVNIAHQHHRHPCRRRKAHVGNIAPAQVHLGRAARALHDHQIMRRLQPGEAVQHRRHQRGLQRRIVPRLHRGDAAALHDDLRSDFAFGLEQHRVHVGMRLKPASQRLKRLRPPDLAAIHRDGGIVGHILRLERRDRQAPQFQCSTNPSHQHRLADVGACPLDHQRPAHAAGASGGSICRQDERGSCIRIPTRPAP